MSVLRDDQLVALADLIAERLAVRAVGELIDAAELARRIGRPREFVYSHSSTFGAIRFGDGARPRLLFRWPAALDRLAELEEQATIRKRQPRKAETNRPRRQRPNVRVELLPVRERGGGRRP